METEPIDAAYNLQRAAVEFAASWDSSSEPRLAKLARFHEKWKVLMEAAVVYGNVVEERE